MDDLKQRTITWWKCGREKLRTKGLNLIRFQKKLCFFFWVQKTSMNGFHQNTKFIWSLLVPVFVIRWQPTADGLTQGCIRVAVSKLESETNF